MRPTFLSSLRILIFCLAPAGLAWGVTPKPPATSLDLKEFFKPELFLSTSNLPLQAALAQLPNRARWEAFLAQRGENAASPASGVFFDRRSGAVTNVLIAVPLVPGSGAGNHLSATTPVDAEMVESALLTHVKTHGDLLGIDVSQLGPARVTKIHDDLWQASIPQHYRGVAVRDGRLMATISHGNLVLLGTEAWGDVRGLDVAPRVPAQRALEAGFTYADGRSANDRIIRDPMLEILPFAPPEHQDGEAFAGAIGQGYGHRLAWSFVFQRVPDESRWEVLVDARDGQVLAFQDINRYVSRSIKGGVYPLTNTGICPTPEHCGTMQSGWPMPFADTDFPPPDHFTNAAGVYDYSSGTATTTLAGKHVLISDDCGPISNSSPTGDIDLGGENGQHDCESGGGSPGNTPAARTAFYEVNRIAEMARGYLPDNAWLAGSLTAQVNLPQSCGAFYNGSAISFYRSGFGCANTGEIAGVLDHEWGHGLDDNDANGFLSNPSEAYADIAGIYRLQTACVGYGFFQSVNFGCGMTQDGTGFNCDNAEVGPTHCDLDCSGVRGHDWDMHADHTPDTALGFVCNACLGGSGPCGREVFCAASPPSQAAWDLVRRDLPAPPFGMDSETAFLTGNRLFYLGSGNIGAWYACTCGGVSNGCGATNAYMQWLAADDDDGNVANGTPHMTALFAAFDRHGIACNTPPPQNSGCAGGPVSRADLSVEPRDNAAALTWTAVPGASGYWVYRTEGHAGCNLGKVRIADVTGLSFRDGEVANGREYYYNVVAHGASQACFGLASNCANVTPGGAELIVNGGFENGCGPWVPAGPGVRCNQGGPNPHGGNGYLELGGRNDLDGRVHQEVAIPSAAPAELTFWLSIATREPTTAAGDVLHVEVRDTSDALLATVATFGSNDAGPYAQRGPFSLASFAGQTVRLYFRGKNDPSLPTTFRLDDVALR